MSGPRGIIEAVGARGGTAVGIVDHLIVRGPRTAREIGREFSITRQGARAQLVRLRDAGVLELERGGGRVLGEDGAHRYYVEPDALRCAARWLDALAERAEHANHAAGLGPVRTGRSR